MWLMTHRKVSGLFNLGSGQARSFLDLSRQVFRSLNQTEDIRFIDTPADIRDTYQYFTEARMAKLLAAGYDGNWHSLEAGVADYVQGYLMQDLYY